MGDPDSEPRTSTGPIAYGSSEREVRDFYEKSGWKTDEAGITRDARLFEDLRDCSAQYVSLCRRRVKQALGTKGELLLDAGSGPVQYAEYLDYSAAYEGRVCLDISFSALDGARRRLGAHVLPVQASITRLPFPDDAFDSTVSLHTIYHVESFLQAVTVLELVRVTKPGRPIVAVYANPNRVLGVIRRLFRLGRRPEPPTKLYYFAYPLRWWRQFEDVASVDIRCWRSITTRELQRLVPNSAIGAKVLGRLFRFEERFPWLSARLGAYPLVVLTKHSGSSLQQSRAQSPSNEFDVGA